MDKKEEIIDSIEQYGYGNITIEQAANEIFDLFVVSRSVWLVQNESSLFTRYVFSTKKEAEECVKGLKHFVINEVRLM